MKHKELLKGEFIKAGGMKTAIVADFSRGPTDLCIGLGILTRVIVGKWNAAFFFQNNYFLLKTGVVFMADLCIKTIKISVYRHKTNQ